MALNVVVFSDFICPFCYIGFSTLRKLKAEFDLQIEWRGFEIHPDWPAEGVAPEMVFRDGDGGARKAAWERIAAMAADAEIEMRPPQLLVSSHLALLAAEQANEAGKGEEFEDRIYRAYFGDGANIADISVIKGAASAAGLDAATIEEATLMKYELQLQNNALVAHRNGISGVPTFIIGGFALAGAQSEDAMRKILTRAVERFGTSHAAK